MLGADRFLAEIKTTANLQHPHILPLFDSGEADGFLFYVMPYVEGESLRDRLDRERQLPVEEAVRITTDLAEALHAAHEEGVVHRDVKPANILLSRGRPLVADFGIALAVSAAGGGRMTETGLSLGTPHYMSPEQAVGDQTVSRTTDIYALGCVLYEMLVGEPPYTGGTAQAILGKIISGELSPARTQRASVPANLDAAIRKALERVPADRFASTQDLARALADPGFRYGEAGVVGAARSGIGDGRWRRLAVGAMGMAALLAVVAAWGWLQPGAAGPPPAALRAVLPFPTDSGPSSRGFALSPDGTQLAFVTASSLDGGRVWIRSMQNGQQRPLLDTEQAQAPAWSPTGDRIAYRAANDTEIRVVPAEGGPVVTVADLAGGLGMPSWTPGGDVVFLADGGIMTVPGSGGPVELILPMEEVSYENGVVEPLPDGRGFLAADLSPSTRGIFAGDVSTKEYRSLIQGAGHPRYRDGWLIYKVRGGALLAQPFDPASGQLGEPAVPLADEVLTPGGRTQASIQSNTLVFAARSEGASVPLVWTDGSGTRTPLAESSMPSGWMRTLSRDGARIASGGFGLSVVETDGGLPRRIEEAGRRTFRPRWSEDGRSLLYEAADGLRAIGTNPGDSAVLVLSAESGRRFTPVGWGPDGEVLFIEFFADGSSELRALESDGATAPRTVQPGATNASLSPDGRWLAYVSERGNDDPQVFVRAYPGREEIRISTEDGLNPTWGPDGDEVYFVTERGRAWRVSLSFAGALTASSPEPVPFDGGVDDVWAHPDGRLLLNVSGGGRESLDVIRDWKSLAGGGS